MYSIMKMNVTASTYNTMSDGQSRGLVNEPSRVHFVILGWFFDEGLHFVFVLSTSGFLWGFEMLQSDYV